MRIDGKIAKWNDDRGFGFISPNHDGQEIFAHISAFQNDGQRPKLGEPVSFEIEIDQSGKKRAILISYSARAKVSRRSQYNSGRPKPKQGFLGRLFPIFLIGLAIYGYSQYSQRAKEEIATQNLEIIRNENTSASFQPQTIRSPESISSNSSDAILSSAYNNGTSNLQIEGGGQVISLLPDDLNGSRHQRFIVRLNSGQTLLVAHNIDLAPRINSLAEGDQIRFYGEYEWNEKGGVIHWTHNDPNGFHLTGWIEHNGKRYQ